MKRYKIVELKRSLEELKQDKKYNKYVLFSIVKTLKTLEPIIADIVKEEEKLYSDEYKTYENSRLSLLKVYADKNENGEPIIKDNIVQVTNKYEEFEVEFNKLKENNKEILESTLEKSKSFNEYMEEEVEVEITKFKFEYMPDELLPSEYITLEKLLEG